MKKIVLLLIYTLCIVYITFGQERKLLTMEDAILNRNLNPKNYSIRWSSDYPNQYLHKEDSIWYAIDVHRQTASSRLYRTPS